jgi:non-ribosomal peptide synthetase component E (peptide arylation enzyme)
MNLLDVMRFRQAGQWAARNYYRNFGDSASTHPTDGAVVADRMRLSYKLCSRRRRAVADSGSGVNARK